MVNYAPDTTSRATDWRDDALCREEDPDLFFPIGNTGDAILQADQAKAVCRRCPVMETCGSWALRTGQDAGVWGGMSEDERRAIKRRKSRPRPACGKETAYRRHLAEGEPVDIACQLAHAKQARKDYQPAGRKAAS